MTKLKIKKGDIVFVRSGNDKDKRGRVLRVFPDKNLAIVEGINIVHKHKKSRKKEGESNIEKSEAPIHICKLQVICPETDKPTRVGKRLNKDGKLVRYSKKSPNKVEIK